MKQILLVLLMAPTWLTAQVLVKGRVVDDTGRALSAVTISVEGQTLRTSSNAQGEYTINAPSGNAVLVFNFIGFTQRKIQANSAAQLSNVVLVSEVKSVDEVVVVGFGTQKKVTVTGAISSVKGEELEKSPVANLGHALVGRTPGLMARQSSGQPGNDNVTFRIRGAGTMSDASPLVLVDGVEREFTEIDPSEVDNITLLKDAAMTAVYGIRGANGVILVTTKKGLKGPAKVSFSSQLATQSPTRLPDFVDSYDWATLYNEALLNDNPNSALPFSEEDLQKYKDGSDPIMHPNTDWFDYMMKKSAPQARVNLNVNGGTESAKYFISLSYLEQDGLWKEFNQQYGYSNNDNYKRFNFRGNTDFNITSSTLLSVGIGGISGKRHRSANPFYNMMTSAPILSPGIVDGKIVQMTKLTSGNPIKALSTGYDDHYDNNLNLTFDLSQKLDFIVPGLLIRSKMGYNAGYNTTNGRDLSPAVYNLVYMPVDGVETLVYQPIADASIGNQLSMTYSGREKRTYFEGALQYNKSFNKHNVGALLLYNHSKKYWPGLQAAYELLPMAIQGAVGRFTYDYQNRYLLEFNMGYNGSENFPEKSRFGWFPAVSAGWNVTHEPWMQSIIDRGIFSRLKLRASYGEVGNDRLGSSRYLYYPAEYVNGTTSYFGEDQKSYVGYTEGKLGNPDITWEKSIKQNYGFESAFFRDRLTLNIDYFREMRDNIIVSLGTVPGFVAASLSDGYNIGKMSNQGFEVELGWNGKIGNLGYFINGNYSFARNKTLFYDEAMDLKNPNLIRTGHPWSQPFGLIAEGIFNSQEEIDNWPVQFSGSSTPGDVKYRDVNGDGVVNENDRAAIGYNDFPEINFGSNMGFSYKNFDFSVLFQGAANASRFLTGFMQRPAVQYGQTLEAVKDERWTPDNIENAIRPKLTVTYGNANNYAQSTLWMRDASYLRLKNMEFGYRFHAKALKKVGLSSVRLYASGQNLFTFDKLKYVDPEGATSDSFVYPQLKIYNLGVNIQF